MSKYKVRCKEAVGAAFYKAAGAIVDTQIEFTPDQRGWFNVVILEDGSTPIIEFSNFPAETLLRLKSPSGTPVKLGLKAAAAAISLVAANLVLWKAHEVHELSDKSYDLYCMALGNFNTIHRYIFAGCEFTKAEQSLIARYVD